MLTALSSVQIAASEGGFHAPGTGDFFPSAIFGHGTFFEFNRLTLIRIIATVVLLSVLVIAARRATLVPGRLQSAVEMILDFVRVSIVEDVMGKENGRRYVPMLTTIFVTILAFNLTGIVPGLNMAGTSTAGVALILALWVFVGYWGAGIRKFGFVGYVRNNLFPPGIPWPIYIILAPIELLQLIVIRPASLLIRLTANMVAGHIMLALTFAATQYFLFSGSALAVLSPLTLVSGIALTLFEVFVAALQAYIFALLGAVYINMSLEEEH